MDCNLSPRGDENIPEVNHNHATAIAIYPREGTKTAASIWPICTRVALQFIPARGRKLVLSSFAIGFRQLQFIPARGRKLYSLSRFSQLTGLQFIPARGRKRIPILVHIFPLYYNLSLQGDGKLLGAPTPSSAYNYNLSPQGDGNVWFCIAHLSAPRLQFIPARGRKLSVYFMFSLFLSFIAIYPREGTKKHLCHWRLPAAEVLCFFYILFYRLGATPAGIVFVTGSALTPCGTSGFMGRISCR